MSDGTRNNLNEGQELVYSDLNKTTPRIEKHLFDRILYELMQRKTDGFFSDSFKLIYSTATSAQIKSGVGFMENSGVDDWEAQKQPLYNAIDTAINFTAPNPTNPRLDIVVVKAILIDGDIESRKFKNESTGIVTNEDFVTSKDYSYDVQVVAGTPDGSPVAEEVPAGYILIATCLISATTGMSGQGAIIDERSLLPLAGPASATGTFDFDKVVGDTTKGGVTHANLKAALDDAIDGDKILVLESEAISVTPVVNNKNIEILFKRGVTFTKDGVVTGLQIDEDDCKIINGRFLNFSAGGDKAILNSAGTDRTMFRDLRFNNCDTNISDLGSKTSEIGTINE